VLLRLVKLAADISLFQGSYINTSLILSKQDITCDQKPLSMCINQYLKREAMKNAETIKPPPPPIKS